MRARAHVETNRAKANHEMDGHKRQCEKRTACLHSPKTLSSAHIASENKQTSLNDDYSPNHVHDGADNGYCRSFNQFPFIDHVLAKLTLA